MKKKPFLIPTYKGLPKFLVGVNDNLDKEHRDLLHQDPLSTLDAAYATIRREIARRGKMIGTSSLGPNPSKIGNDLEIHHRSKIPSSRHEDQSNLKCTHFGGSRHTREGCFKLVGYSELWDELKQRKVATKATVSRINDKANLTIVLPGDWKPPQEAASDTHKPLTGNERSNERCSVDNNDENEASIMANKI